MDRRRPVKIDMRTAAMATIVLKRDSLIIFDNMIKYFTYLFHERG